MRIQLSQREYLRFYSKTAIALLFLCMFLVLLSMIKTAFNYYDEGIAVFNATRVLDGDTPYKDFWAIYPPGQFYTLATIFRIFGTNLLVARIFDTIVRFIIVVSVYLIAKKTTTLALALFVSIVTTFLLAYIGYYACPVFPSLALGLLSILSLIEFVNTGQRRWLLLTGILIGITTLFRLDFGLYAGISVASTLILFHYSQIINKIQSPIKPSYAALNLLMTVLGAALLIILPCYCYLGFRSGYSNLWTQVVVFPATEFHDVRWIPYPKIIPFFLFAGNISSFTKTYLDYLEWLRFYLPLVIFGIAFFHYSFSFFRKRIASDTQNLGAIALIIFGVLLFTQALSRYDSIHVLPSSIITFLIIISLVHQVIFKIHNRIIKYSSLLLLTILIYLYVLFPLEIIVLNIKNFSPLGCYSQLDRASCVYLDRDQERAIQYIREHTSDGESIFVGNQRHDCILANCVGFYFLSGRPCATKYHELHPGVATTCSIQELIVYEIESKKVKWIVLVNLLDSIEPNASAVSSGVYFLDDFIRSKYAPIVKFGNYEIWKGITK